MVALNDNFYFVVIRVCKKFLAKPWRFGIDVQFCVQSSVQFKQISVGTNPNNNCHCLQKDVFNIGRVRSAIISYLYRLLYSTCDSMPLKTECHLPYFQEQVYEKFFVTFWQLYDDASPFLSHIELIWWQYCSSIKVQKFSRFQQCVLCVDLDTRLREATQSNLNTTDFKQKKHIKVVPKRVEY